jgi:hypothetical protein
MQPPSSHLFSVRAEIKARPKAMTRQEIEQRMDELAREYYDSHDPEIPEEIFELAKLGG